MMLYNKAGCAANTSRGRMGRGGNACFHTFQLDDPGWTDKTTYRVANPRPKRKLKEKQNEVPGEKIRHVRGPFSDVPPLDDG